MLLKSYCLVCDPSVEETTLMQVLNQLLLLAHNNQNINPKCCIWIVENFTHFV